MPFFSICRISFSFNYWRSLRSWLPLGTNKKSLCVQKGNGIKPASPLVKSNVVSNFIHIHLLILIFSIIVKTWWTLGDTETNKRYQLIKVGDKATSSKIQCWSPVLLLQRDSHSFTRVKRQRKGSPWGNPSNIISCTCDFCNHINRII